ncbi:MAG TPA: GAF domain-containing sensor histidine kinase [Anaerolineales bacterium]|nr:GAF domain-containing sensor histidine kinase [Anaerolineales bacterium]
MFSNLVTFFRSSRVFPFLVVFRWASLIPAVLTLRYHEGQGIFSPLAILLLAILANAVISVFNRRLNQLVLNHPPALGIDLLFSAGILAISGGSLSPYYLYALSPLLAGAFFFQLRGALVVSTVFTPLYFIGNFPDSLQSSDSVLWMTQLAGIWLIPILPAYLSILLRDIRRGSEELARARDELARKHENLAAAHRQLEIIHDLTMLLQAAPDLISVQQRVLGAVTADLGFSKAVVALVDPARQELGGWLVYPAEAAFPAAQPLPLKSENGAVFKALLSRNTLKTSSETLIQNADLNDWLSQTKWLVIPLYLREHPVGLLLVDEPGLTKERENTLMTVAHQAALALGTTILCIDRARRLAVETERNRIARDIHDTVAQSLFGIVYSLDACINMLPSRADSVRNELIELRSLASGAHDEVRRSIFDLWPSALNIELFMADLTNYISNCCRPRPFSIIFNNSGDFDNLSAGLRRTIYRMAQEALANSARHSGAQSARLCLNVADERVYLSINDEGRGFDPSSALSRSLNREHFGLHSIQERARAMGGDCEVISRPGTGTRILIELPAKGNGQHG